MLVMRLMMGWWSLRHLRSQLSGLSGECSKMMMPIQIACLRERLCVDVVNLAWLHVRRR